MATLNHPTDEQSLDATANDEPGEHDPLEGRLRRIAALKGVVGLWAKRTDIPADGLEYQRELRSEWR